MLCVPALAYGDDRATLFVATSGADKGSCDNPVQPCRSISYALRVAGKSADIRVASGTYPVDSAEDLFHMVTGVISVTGSYSRGDKFRFPGAGPTILSGVPHEYREQLGTRGLQIVADRKAIDPVTIDTTNKMMQMRESLQASLPATPCVGGVAGALPCNQVDLLSHVALADISAMPSAANDVWGFTDLNSGREYAIVGFNFGTAVIDVTNPETPREVGFVQGQRASWRDIKVYQYFDAVAGRWKAYAYVTTDGSTDGLFVIDLSGLPHSVNRVAYSSDIQRAHNVYISNADYSTGIIQADREPLLIVAGSEIGGGRFRAYSLADPEAPLFLGGPATADYMHDAASILISDTRKDTQCQIIGPICEVLLDFNESSLEIWDITDAAAITRLSSSTYGSAGYVHSGWWTEDKQYVFVQDELDENQQSLPTTLRIFSLADLRNPVHVGTWSGPTGAIDHNGFVRGNRYYMSNYSRGLSILDITAPASPALLGFIDTSPSPEQAVFAGAWGVYPYFPSGSIAVNDMQSGLYMVSDRTRDVAQGTLQFSAGTAAVTEGQQAQLPVQRVAGAIGTVSVDYEVLSGSAEGNDYQALSGVLLWSDADTADKFITIAALGDADAEGLEQLIVRLLNPTGGATLGNANIAAVFVSDSGAAAGIAYSDTMIDIAERGFATAVVVLRREGTAGGVASVDYSISGGDATAGSDYVGSANGTISWAAGDGNPKTIEFAIIDDGVSEATEFFDLTLSNPIGATINGSATLRINIEDGSGVNQAPNAIAGPSQTVNQATVVRLDGGQSSDADGDTLTYLWEQVSGPAVILSNSGGALSQFTAPGVNSDTMLQFRLTVTDPRGLGDASTVTITVVQGAQSFVNGGGSFGMLSLYLLIFLNGVRAFTLTRD